MRGRRMIGYTYLVSDTFDHELPVFVSDSLAEIQEFLGNIGRRSLSIMMCRHQLIKKRYFLERVDIRENNGAEKGF